MSDLSNLSLRAVSNSASIPGVVEPEVDQQSVIADGGVLSPVPVAV